MKQITLEEYTEALKVVRAYIAQIQDEIKPLIEKEEANKSLLYDCDISVRLLNLFHSMVNHCALPKEPKVHHLAKFSVSDLMKQGNFGKKSLTEIEKLLSSAGLKLKSDD